MKKKINSFLEYLGHFFIFFSCYFKLPSLCAYLIRISILKNKIFKNELRGKKIIIVLDRLVGHREVEIIRKSTNKAPEFLFLRRSITKLIFFYFCNKKKIFFNYVRPMKYKEGKKYYFNQNKTDQKEYEQFWTDIIFNLKKYYSNKILNFVTFNYTYYDEVGLYTGCKRNNVPIKLWYKEGIKTALEAEHTVKASQFNHMLKFFSKISVYNKIVKKMFVKMDKSNSKKVSINGCPRLYDYIIKKKYQKKIKNILFLSFDSKRGIPQYKKNKNLNWNFSYNKVIKILNELSNDNNLNIVIKRKNKVTYRTPYQIDNRIKIFESGTAEQFINHADIIIGHNSASTIEALVNGKYVMVPFFEKKLIPKKYLYNFNKEVIYTSEKKMKKNILNLVNKKVSFPLKNKKHQKTIEYYLGNSKNITKKYLNFLNS